MGNTKAVPMHLVFLILLSFVNISIELRDDQAKLKKFLENEDMRHRSESDNKTVVKVNMYILSLGGFDTEAMEYDVSLYLRQKWTDSRTKDAGIKGVVKIPSILLDNLWTPDTFFLNKKNGETDPKNIPERFLRINFSSGEIQSSVRLSLKVFCSMDVSGFPFDAHVCTLGLESYSFNADEMEYIDELVTLDKNGYHSNRFSYVKDRYTKLREETSTGPYERVFWKFLIERNHGGYLMQVILPTVVLVLISCISYWLHPLNSASSRILLGIGCIIALVPIQIFGRVDCQAGYVVTHDCWTLACFLFIIISIVELLVVHMILHLRKKKPFDSVKEDPNADSSFIARHVQDRNDSIIDRICRFLVPVLFILFAIIFWAVKKTAAHPQL